MDPTDAKDDDADLMEGFDSTSHDDFAPSSEGAAVAGSGEGKADGESAADATPKASEAGSPSTPEMAADPYADLPPQVRDLLAVAARVPDLERQLSAVTEHSRRFEGQVRSMQSRLDKQAAAASKAPQALERIDRAREAYEGDMPELADALEELKGLLPQPLEPEDVPAQAARTAQPAHVNQAPNQPAQAGIDPVALAHMETLDALAPSWFDDLNSTDAQLWLTTRKDMADEFKRMKTATQVLRVHGEFTKYLHAQRNAQTLSATRAARVAAAATPQGVRRQAPPARMSSEDDDMLAGFQGR